MSTTNYRLMTDEELLDLRHIYRTNLANLELQAAKFGELHVPVSHRNDLDASRKKLGRIDAELRRRAGGVLPDPPELIDIRQQIAKFEQALTDFAGDALLTARFEGKLDELRDQEAAILHRIADYAGAIRQQAPTVATDMERSRQADHASHERSRGQREQFVNRRRIELDLNLFRDRLDERDHLLRLLSDPAARVIQIIGPGGMGKTALAWYAVLTVYNNGFSVPVHGTGFHAIVYHSYKDTNLTFEMLLRDLARVCPDHAETINELQRSGDYPAQVQGLLELLCDLPLLLVLDNCETMMDDAGILRDPGIAVLVDELMTPNHQWRVILTSRREVYARADRARYARIVRLHTGLPFADAKLFLHDLDPEGRTGLPGTPDSVLEPIVARLHGRPRLLETFVALLKESTYTPAALLAQPETLDRITEALHDWLTVAERAILRALAVWGAPAPRDGLEFLLLPDFPGLPLDRTLARLERNGVISVSSELFSLHSLDAAVALRETPETESTIPTVRRLHERVAEYYAGRELPREQWRGIDDLAPQIARVEHLTAAGLHDAAAEVLRLIDFDYLLLWGYAQRIIALREPLELQLTQLDLQMYQANLLGACYYTIGRVREAIPQYERGAAIAKTHNDRGWQSAFLDNLGSAYADLGKLQQAIEFHEQALVISRKIGNRYGEGNVLGNLGVTNRLLGSVQWAIDLYEQQLMIVREIGNRLGEGAALGNLGNAYYDLGAVQRAIGFHEQYLVIVREIGDRSGEGKALGNLGLAYASLGEVQRAIGFHEQALLITREIGNRRNEGIHLLNTVNVMIWTDQKQTLQFYELAMQLFNDVDSAEGKSRCLLGLAQLDYLQNNPALARERYTAALALDQPQTAGKAAWGCGVAALLGGEREQALTFWHDAAARCATMRELAEYRYLAAAVGVALAVVDPDAAPERGAEALQALREILAKYPLPLWAAECRRDLRYVAQALGGGQDAALLEEALGLLEPIAAQMEQA